SPPDNIRSSSAARFNILHQQPSPYVPYASNIYGVYRREQQPPKISNNNNSKPRRYNDRTTLEYADFQDTRIGFYDDDDDEDEEEFYEMFDYNFSVSLKNA
ncbi:unnamed protein product, partial [Didymodactylos carnosus]